jgi:GNAT superfamily N-acetyltransferase
VEFRTLGREELELIWTIDRREFIARSYRLEDGELRLYPLNVDIAGWDPANVERWTPLFYESYDLGATFYGAFDGTSLAGVAMLDTIWRGAQRDLLALEFFHVGRDYRAAGVGTRLFEQARDGARERGARGLYVSATPSENTIRFYLRRGCVVMETPDPELFALEPEDIHLECVTGHW